MKEIRLSIPVVGGITVVYTEAEVEAKTLAVKAAFKSAYAYTSRFVGRVMSLKSKEITVEVKTEYTVCPACGAHRPKGVCSVHGSR